MSISKNGTVMKSMFQEHGTQVLPFPGFNSGTSKVVYTNGQYVITSPVSSSTWGANFSVATDKIHVPYGMTYKLSMDVYVPTKHTLRIDVNNKAVTGGNWNGNDNDLGNTRVYVPSNLTIPAETWTTISWTAINIHPDNVNQVDLIVYDGIGLYNKDDTETTTWYIKNPKIEIGFDLNTALSLSNEKILMNNFFEV